MNALRFKFSLNNSHRPVLFLSIFYTLFSLNMTSCQTQSVIRNETLQGKWFIDLQQDDIGAVRTFIEFETNNENFEAFTRKKADKDILGGWTAMLGRTFTKSFKHGSLLRVVNGVHQIENDTLKLTGIFTTPMGNFYFNGHVTDHKLYAELTNRANQLRGTIKGEKKQVKEPLEDYPALFEQAVQLTEDKIYNRDLLQTGEWKSFVKNMRKTSAKVQDDLEMVFAYFYYAGKLPVSHYALMIIPQNKNEDTADEKETKYIFLEEKSAETAYLKITSFGGTALEMDRTFEIINQRNYKNLIVDLRNNSGGSVEAGIAFASSIVDSTLYAGVLLTQKWFNQNKQLPAIGDYPNFHHFTEANFDLIIEGIHNTEGLCLKIIPKETVYRGNLYILTNGRTASTCEPIIYELKKQKRAVIVGEKTAGAMLNGELFELDKGFSMVIPTADYYASDGFRIDQNGIHPDIETKREDALKFLLDKLNE